MHWVTGIAGTAFIAAPFVGGYAATDPAGLWRSIAVGIAVVLISVKWAVSKDKVATGCEVLAVSWFSFIAPLEIGFVNGDQAKLTGLVLGGILCLLVSVRMAFGYDKSEPKSHGRESRALGRHWAEATVTIDRLTGGHSQRDSRR